MNNIHLSFLFICALLGASGAAAEQANGRPGTSTYTQIFSEVESEAYLGGTYKYSNVANFPGSPVISASLITLVPGGLRELHWHNASEWAIVLNGTCRATVMESLVPGTQRPTETWDFGAGDIWYFRPNEAHMVQGLAPTGCTYLAGYNDGAFDDKKSLSMSAWASTLPPEILAESLGVNASVISSNLAADTFSFLPLGPVPNISLDEFQDSLARPPAQAVLQTHRFQLSESTPIIDAAGGWVREASSAAFPIATDMSGALIRFAPGGLRQVHWHPTLSEWQFVINGTLRVGVFMEPGVYEEGVLGAGDAGYAPKGSGHWLQNPSTTEDAYCILIFDNGPFTSIELPWVLGNVPFEVSATTLNTSVAFTEAINYSEPSMAVLKPAT